MPGMLKKSSILKIIMESFISLVQVVAILGLMVSGCFLFLAVPILQSAGGKDELDAAIRRLKLHCIVLEVCFIALLTTLAVELC